ncbi:hypothetical protein Hte_000045 [Hypoxylon texense]
MDTHQTVTPVSSQGKTGHSPVPGAEGFTSKVNQPNPRTAPKQDAGARPIIQKPLYSQLDRRFQIKLLDLCTEYQGVYYKSERLDDFWDMIADILSRDFRIPVDGQDAETWVEGICREAKGYLTQGVAFPRRADREDLDIAIEVWLEVEGRRRLQKAASEMRMGYILAFGPEMSAEEHLLAGPCLHKVRENADKIKTAVSEKGKASRKTSILLVRKIEALVPKPTQKPSMAEHSSSSSSNNQSETTLPALNPISHNVTSCRPDNTHLSCADVDIGSSNMGKAPAQEPPSMPPRAPDAPNSSPCLFTRSSPIRGPSPILGGLDSPIKDPSRYAKGKKAERHAQSHSSPVTKPVRSKTRASIPRKGPSKERCETAQQQQKHADVNTGKSSRSGSPAVKKHAMRPNAAKSKKTPTRNRAEANLPCDPIGAGSSKVNSRKPAASPSGNTIVCQPINTQDQRQSESNGGISTDSPHRVRQEKGKSPAASILVPLQKGKNKRSSSGQGSSPNKIQRTQYDMNSPLSIGISLHEDAACHDNDDVGDEASGVMSSSNDLPEPQAPPIEHNGEHNGEHHEGRIEVYSGGDPGIQETGPTASVPSSTPVIIDLTQSPSRDQVKKEEEQEGPGFGDLGGRLLSQLTTNLHGAVGLTEHIKEIVGRTISQSLEEFEHRALGTLEEMRNEWRALEDNRHHS